MLLGNESRSYLIIDKSKFEEFVQNKDFESTETQALVGYIEQNNLKSQFEDAVWTLIKDRLWRNLSALGITSVVTLGLAAWSLYSSAEKSAEETAKSIANRAVEQAAEAAKTAVDSRIGDQIEVVRKNSFEVLQENMDGKARLDTIMEDVSKIREDLRKIEEDRSIEQVAQVGTMLKDLGGAEVVSATFQNSLLNNQKLVDLTSAQSALESGLADASELLSTGTHGCKVGKVVGPTGWETACEKTVKFSSPVSSTYDVVPSMVAFDFPKGGFPPIYQLRVENKSKDGFTILVKSAYQHLNHVTFSWIAVKRPAGSGKSTKS